MRFRFVGDPRNNGDGPEEFEKFEHSFSRDKWTEVDDQFVIGKLINSRHFEAEIASDGSMIDDAPKRKGGWPKGKPRKPKDSDDVQA
jgi:hypothetical protein